MKHPHRPTLDEVGLEEIYRSRRLLDAYRDLVGELPRDFVLKYLGANGLVTDAKVIEWHRKWTEEQARELEEEADLDEKNASDLRRQARELRRSAA